MLSLRRTGLPRVRLLNNRGDTIIEVMIVLAVLGLALGISYATANRSLADARQAQENTQATQILQGQAESLRSLAANPSGHPDNIYRSGSFCIADSGHVTTPPNCNLGEASRYQVTISWGGAGTDTFTIRAVWENISGDITDTNTLLYRVHKPAASAPTGTPPPSTPPSTPPPTGGGCPGSSTGYSDQTVTGSTSGIVWGTGPYTNDSHVGTAAVHAGLISPGQTAVIRVCAMPGQSSYAGSTRNGVTTFSWGSWPGSFTLVLVGGAQSCPSNSTGHYDQTVTGTGSGSVWGSGPYTDDSTVGKAAVHAGLISVGQSAVIRVCSMPGQSSYTGSTKNGITTSNWGSWPGSYTLIKVSGG